VLVIATRTPGPGSMPLLAGEEAPLLGNWEFVSPTTLWPFALRQDDGKPNSYNEER
jgi:hypothetical protein